MIKLWRQGKRYFILILIILVSYIAINMCLIHKEPNILGYQFYNVLSGSMSPTFNKGSLIIVKLVDSNAIKVDDVITFSGVDNPQLTTHRVVGISQEDETYFTTKGDANDVVDPFVVSENQLVGKVVCAIPYLGTVVEVIQERPIIIIILMVSVMLLYEGSIILFKNIYHQI